MTNKFDRIKRSLRSVFFIKKMDGEIPASVTVDQWTTAEATRLTKGGCGGCGKSEKVTANFTPQSEYRK